MADVKKTLQLSQRDSTILNSLYPPFKKQVLAFLNLCWKNELPTHLVSGFRTFAEQDSVYKSGKSKVKGGYSYHNYGLAVDIVFDNSEADGIQDPYTPPTSNAWLLCAQLGLKCGLQPGYFWASFQDKPHYQAVIKSKLEDLKSAYIKGGMDAVHDVLYMCERDSFKLPPTSDILDEWR